MIQNVYADVDSYIWDDSQITLLVAMLSLAYKLQYDELEPANPDISYDDGHISFELASKIAPEPSTSQWWRDEPDDFSVDQWDQVMNTIPEFKNVIHTQGLSQRSMFIIRRLLAGKKKTTRLAFDLEIPIISMNTMMTGMMTDNFETKDIKFSHVKECISAYVKLNRLEGAFEAAYGIFTQCAVRPIPDTAEGMAWLMRPMTLVLPAFRAHRGLYAMLTNDKAYGISASVTATWKLWKDLGFTIAVQGGLYNAVSLWGRYFVEAGFYHDDAEVGRLGSYEFGEAPSAAYYCYASLVTGHDTYVPVPRNLGLMYDPWLSDGEIEIDVTVADARLTGYDIKREGNSTRLIISQVPQPCSTVHVIGRMPDSGYFRTLSNRFSVDLWRMEEGFEVANVSDAWGVGLAARWLGYDVEMEYRGVSRIANWASNDSSMAARPFHVRGPDRRSVTIKCITPRQRVFGIQPPLTEDKSTWHVQYEIDDSYVIQSRTGTRMGTRGCVMPPAASDPSVAIVDLQATMYTPITLRITNRANVKSVGFQVLPPQTSHVPPRPANPILQSEDVTEDDVMDEGGGTAPIDE